MVARVFHGLGSGVCEALPVQLVNDIFFLHERGKRLGYYTVCLCLGSTGPLYAGYMLAGGYSWRLFFYVEIAFASALFILAFFFVEESTYHRNVPVSGAPSIDVDDKAGVEQRETVMPYIPPRKSYISTLRPWSNIDHDAEFFMTMIRPFSYFFVPAVFWVICTYGKGPSSLYTCDLANIVRYLHRSWSIGIQLHLPHQDRGSSIQLVTNQFRSHRSGEHNRLFPRHPSHVHV